MRPTLGVLTAALCLALATSACTPSNSAARSNSPRTVSPLPHGTLTQVSPQQGNKRVSLGGASVVIPKRWFRTPFRGVPATVVSPIVFFSSSPMITGCAKPDQRVCTSQDWFPRDVTTPSDGTLVLWSDIEMAIGLQWSALLGRRTEIHHHIAKVGGGRDEGGCPSGTAREAWATIEIPTKPIKVGSRREYPGSRLQMSACFGKHASTADRMAVSRMLQSLRIHPRYWIR